jgi:glycerate kinase
MPHKGKLSRKIERVPGPHKVLVAPDKFKGTLTARAAGEAIASGWRRARPEDQMQLMPISDGGDGFGAAIGELLGMREVIAASVDAAHRRIRTRWWWDACAKTGVVESARVIGLAMLPPGRFHPFDLDTYGLGKVLQHVARRGARRCLVGLGGSATNDGGFGLGRGLGWRFLDKQGQEITRWIDLRKLHELEPPHRKLAPAQVMAAVDVQNPLLGARGATRIYGPQKGIRPQDYELAEKCLKRLERVVEQNAGGDLACHPGAGAAGGLGFGLLAFAGARLVPGFDLFSREAGLSQKLRWADLVLTGEGSIDSSTMMGKGVGELALECGALGKPCIGFGGVVSAVGGAAARLFKELRGLTQIADETDAKARAGFWLEELAFRTAKDWRHRA